MIEMIDNPGDARITAGAERMRASQQCRREGMQCLVLEVHDSEIDGLVAAGYLSADAQNDRNAVAGHLTRFWIRAGSVARIGICARMPPADNALVERVGGDATAKALRLPSAGPNGFFRKQDRLTRFDIGARGTSVFARGGIPAPSEPQRS
jgi:hypothetical protein